ncbi:MAG: hypothetical protein IJW29_00090 [Clostridia bacterium]|nr:hypothetical protein [Clostridia bacterium]
MKTRKATFTKLLVCLFALCLMTGLLAALPIPTFAEEGTAVEAKWGASADSLTGSGSFAEAVAALESDGVNYIQLQSDLTVGTVDWDQGKEITLDLAGHTLTLTGIHYLCYNTVLTVTDTSAEGSGTIIQSASVRIFECQDGSGLILEKVILGDGDEIYVSIVSLTVKKDVKFDQLFYFKLASDSASLDLSAVTDTTNLRIEYICDQTAVANTLLVLPEGLMPYTEDGYATEILVCNGGYSLGPIPESKFTYTFSANGGTGTMEAVSAYSQIILPENGFTAPADDKQFKAWEVNGVEYDPGDVITVEADTTVKAIWQDYVPQIVLKLTDGYGDGWNNAAIKVYKDGELVFTTDFAEGATQKVVLDYDSEAEYTFYWTKGGFDYECSLEIFIDGTSAYSCDDASNLATDTPFYTVEAVTDAKITGAAVLVGKDLSIVYFVKFNNQELLEQLDGITMVFTFGGKSVSAFAGEANENGEYEFVFAGIAPQQMADVIKAELKNGDTVITSKESYSVKENLQSLLNKHKDDTTDAGRALVQLVTDMLTYGAAAQTYLGYNTANLATNGVENMGTPSVLVPDASDMTLSTSLSDTLYFKAAGLWFDNVNMIYVKISTTEDASLKVLKNGALIDTCTAFVEVNGGVGYMTDAIYATDFDDVYTFELYEGETLVQTLTYSVKSYAYQMQSNTDMAALASALYRYGASAVTYERLTDGVIDTAEELQAALNAGGTVILGSSIELGDSTMTVSSGKTVTLDLSGYTLSANSKAITVKGTLTVTDTKGGGVITSGSGQAIDNYGTLAIEGGTLATADQFGHVIVNYGALTVNGGALTGGEYGYAIYAASESTTTLVGNDFTLYGGWADVFWAANDAMIDLSAFTGESLAIESAEADMDLSKIILPTGWVLYDENNAAVTATVQWGTITAKAEIAG